MALAHIVLLGHRSDLQVKIALSWEEFRLSFPDS
jgi:hypothetical protein